MPLLDEENRNKVKDFLEDMQNEVEIVYFTQEVECESCSQTHEFLKEISGLNDKLSLTIYDFVDDEDKAKEFGLEQIPAITLLDKDGNHTRIKFYGIPGGYEINSFLTSIMEVSGNHEPIEPNIVERIEKIDKDIDIKVFITLSCPYCPTAVINAHRLALENEHISGEMIESSTFPHLANKYNVTGVPKIVINDKQELTGAQPLDKMLDAIEKL
ncbi:MAG TPA: thioredoxin family protein [bacterium]|nr:thioredoxin family protein [bacterium]